MNGCNFRQHRYRPKIVLNIVSTMPAAIFDLCLADENFARSRDKSNF
jgi:hypothetical protein